ncbi:MAG: ribonuclease HIII [Clostridiales bacterium]|mgnify:CR=1 FL=1|nr:ribonuclease HIII [Clostridiales bacterium]
MDKYKCFDIIGSLFELNQIQVNNKKEINYGIQFEIAGKGQKGIYRIFESKKGIRLDSSQIKDPDFRGYIDEIIHSSTIFAKDTPLNFNEKGSSKFPHKIHGLDTSKKDLEKSKDPVQLIGVDESGKGDYFGPLVIAGVYTDEITGERLKDIGVVDSKRMSDKSIGEKAAQIKEICPYEIVVIANNRYNELYRSIKNLNRLLAWGHARVIENLLAKVDCHYVLSDQFGKPELIQEALMDKGSRIQLIQRTKAEENIAVAAASVVARNEFITRISGLESLYKMEFPKGASDLVINAGKEFINSYSTDALSNVAKVHFKITNQIKSSEVK